MSSKVPNHTTDILLKDEDGEDSWIPEGTLAEIDQKVQSYAEGRLGVGLQATQMPMDGPLDEMETLQAQLLQTQGETKWLRQRLEALQRQLETEHTLHQLEKDGLQRQVDEQAAVFKQQIDVLKTQLEFVHIQEHQMKWKMVEASELLCEGEEAMQEGVRGQERRHDALSSKHARTPSVLAPQQTMTPLGQATPQLPLPLLNAFYQVMQMDPWHPPQLQQLFTHTLVRHPLGLCDASELLLDSFQHQQFQASLTLVRLIQWLSTEEVWMETFLEVVPDGNPRHVAIVVFELVVKCSVHHYRTSVMLEDLLEALLETMRQWLTTSTSLYLWLLSLYQPQLDRVELSYLLQHAGTAQEAMLRWLVYLVPALPSPSPSTTTQRKRASLVSELVRALDRPPLRFHWVRLAFFYFHRFPHLLPLAKWVLLAHDTWCQLAFLPPHDHPTALVTIYLCLLHLQRHPPPRLDLLSQRTLRTLLLQIHTTQHPKPTRPTTVSQRIALRALHRYHTSFLSRLNLLAAQLRETLFSDSDEPMPLPT